MKNARELMRIKNLKVGLRSKEVLIRTLDGIDLKIDEGETVGLV